MSKRLQVLLKEEEYKQLKKVSQQQGIPVAKWVRSKLRIALKQDSSMTAEMRIAAVLKYAKFSGPTGDIESILAEIERGRT